MKGDHAAEDTENWTKIFVAASNAPRLDEGGRCVERSPRINEDPSPERDKRALRNYRSKGSEGGDSEKRGDLCRDETRNVIKRTIAAQGNLLEWSVEASMSSKLPAQQNQEKWEPSSPKGPGKAGYREEIGRDRKVKQFRETSGKEEKGRPLTEVHEKCGATEGGGTGVISSSSGVGVPEKAGGWNQKRSTSLVRFGRKGHGEDGRSRVGEKGSTIIGPIIDARPGRGKV